MTFPVPGRKKLEEEAVSDHLRNFALWVAALDDPAMKNERQVVTLTAIIKRANAAIRADGLAACRCSCDDRARPLFLGHPDPERRAVAMGDNVVPFPQKQPEIRSLVMTCPCGKFLEARPGQKQSYGECGASVALPASDTPTKDAP